MAKGFIYQKGEVNEVFCHVVIAECMNTSLCVPILYRNTEQATYNL